MKKTLSILLTAAMLLCLAPLSGFLAIDWPEIDFGSLFPAAKAAEIVDSGTCGAEGDGITGANITYTLDSEGLLTLSGTGATGSYGYEYYSLVPFDRMAVKSISIEKGVTYVGEYIFGGCQNLKTISIGETVSEIGSNAFSNCTALTEVTVPGTVKEIGNGAFSSCENLTEVTISDGVETIFGYAFNCCAALTSVTIPASVTEIGPAAFDFCPSLASVAVEKGNPVYHSAGNCIIETDSRSLIVGCKNSVIPDDGSVTVIKDGFAGCAGLSDLRIPECVTEIGSYAFRDCTGLTSVTIPDGVTRLGDIAFLGCTGLKKVSLGKGITEFQNSFGGCTELAEITVSEENPLYIASGNCVIEKAAKKLVFGCRGSVIPDDGSVTSIGYWAFSGCTGLTHITIPDSVTSIGEAAFYGCSELTEVALPDSMTNIGDLAFDSCTNLLQINIPDGMTNIGESVFRSCYGLKKVTISNNVTTIGPSAFFCCYGLTDVTIPDSVTSIGEFAFSTCLGLTDVTIPDSVTRIEKFAFSYCRMLAGLVVPSSVTEIGEDAFPEHTVIYGEAGSRAEQWAKENGRAFVPFGNAEVTLHVPEMINEPTVNAYGFTNPGAEIVCCVNGIDVVKVTASANGRWSAAIPLSDAKDEDSFEIKATVTVDGKTAEQTAAVTYKPDTIVFQEFTLNHSCYSVNIKTERLGVSVPNFTFVPGKPLSFKIKVSNTDRVDKLYIVSTKDNASKKMALTYNEATGLWFAEGFFDDADKNYVPGVLTITGVDKDGKEFDTGVTIKINFLIDPSGYVYEAVKSNKLEGVTAAVYYKDAQGHELLWNAETADQLNPITTLADGAFAWVVPEGQWQVRLTKDGYLETRSEWMDVPPEQTNIYIGMASNDAPEVAYCNIYADRAEITFSQYMDLEYINADNVKFDGYTGTFAPLDKTETDYGSDIFYAKTFAFTPDKAFAGIVSVRIENAVNYIGTVMQNPYTATVTVAAEPKNLTAAQNVSVKYGETAEIAISAENAAGKTVSVACASANVTFSAKTLTLDETGKATLTVTGDMPGTANLTFALNGTSLTATTKVAVAFPGVPAEPDNPAEPAFTLGDVDGNGKVESSDARLALRAAVHLSNEPTDVTEGSAGYTAADYDKNGKVESSDARCILRVAVKLDPFA